VANTNLCALSGHAFSVDLHNLFLIHNSDESVNYREFTARATLRRVTPRRKVDRGRSVTRACWRSSRARALTVEWSTTVRIDTVHSWPITVVGVGAEWRYVAWHQNNALGNESGHMCATMTSRGDEWYRTRSSSSSSNRPDTRKQWRWFSTMLWVSTFEISKCCHAPWSDNTVSSVCTLALTASKQWSSYCRGQSHSLQFLVIERFDKSYEIMRQDTFLCTYPMNLVFRHL